MMKKNRKKFKYKYNIALMLTQNIILVNSYVNKMLRPRRIGGQGRVDPPSGMLVHYVFDWYQPNFMDFHRCLMSYTLFLDLSVRYNLLFLILAMINISDGTGSLYYFHEISPVRTAEIWRRQVVKVNTWIRISLVSHTCFRNEINS